MSGDILKVLAHYHQDFESGGANTPSAARLLLAALARLLDAQDVLETGYDAGTTTEALASVGGRVFGIDNLREYAAADAIARERLAGYENVTLVNTDALTYLQDQDDASFDLIFIDDRHSAEHVRAEAIEVRRVLRPGGIAAFHDTIYCSLWAVVEDVFGDWQRIELPCPSPRMGRDFGLGLVRKP